MPQVQMQLTPEMLEQAVEEFINRNVLAALQVEVIDIVQYQVGDAWLVSVSARWKAPIPFPLTSETSFPNQRGFGDR